MKKFYKNLSNLNFALSILLIFYTFYKSEIVYLGEKRNLYILYYFLSFAFLIYSIVFFLIKENIKYYFFIISTSIVVALYMFEFYTLYNVSGYKDKIKKIRLYEINENKKYDTRNLYEVYSDLKKNDKEITIKVPPINYLNKGFDLIPLSGISYAKTINCNENGYYAFYQTDRYGFNNEDNVWDQSETEYFLVGDSFAHGSCVNKPNDIASILSDLTKKNVINAGQSGNGPLLSYATLREFLPKNTKKILWIYFNENDLWDLNKEIKDDILKKYLLDSSFSQELKKKQYLVDQYGKNLIKHEAKNAYKLLRKRIIRTIKLTETRELVLKILPEKNKIPYKPQIDKFEEILDLANNFALKNNSKLIFVYLPGYNELKKNDLDDYYKIKKLVNKLNIKFVDIYQEVLKKHENPMQLYPFGLNAHFNIEGYKVVSNSIYNFTK